MKLIKILPMALLLSACGTPSVDELKNDQDLLEDTVFECQKMKPSAMKKDEGCQNAIKATEEIAMESINGAMKELGNVFK